MQESKDATTAAGDPISYEHMERSLSKVAASNAGERPGSALSGEQKIPTGPSIQDSSPSTKEAAADGAPASAQSPSPHIHSPETSSQKNERESFSEAKAEPDRPRVYSDSQSPKSLLHTNIQTGQATSSPSAQLNQTRVALAILAPSLSEKEANRQGEANSSRIPSNASPSNTSSKLARQSTSPPSTVSGPPRVIHAAISPVVQASVPSTSPPSMQTHPGKNSSGKSGTALRRGKWTVEEEAYVARVIQDFNSGFLNAPAGTTLRSYLSEKLQCDPMRITKKFTGDSCIGKRVFHPAVRNTANSATIDKAQAELEALERRWRRRLEMQQRESAKKAAASVAAANAAAGAGQTMIQGVPVSLLNGQQAMVGMGMGGQRIGQSVVTQAASWLDRANAILQGTKVEPSSIYGSSNSFRQSPGELDSVPSSELEDQMKEVQRLIYEGPLIQHSTAGLPGLLATGQRTSSDTSPGSPAEPADKRMRTVGTISGAEDAEALVGFLRSVRAAAGQES